MRGDQIEKLFALFGIELFGIVQAAEFPRQTGFQPGARKDNRCRRHRTRQWATTRLIHARNEAQAFLPMLAFVSEAVPVLRTHGISCPIAAWSGSRKVLMSSPSPQTITP